MLVLTHRAALLGTVAAFVLGGAHAQTADQAPGDVNPEACAVLAERLAAEVEVEAQLRTDVEEVIATGDVAQCHVVFTAWEEEGAITRESLELVATEQVTERMIVQQEVEVAADVAVYQPPAEVDVESAAPEIVWTMPRQSVTVDEQAPQITVRQARPTITVEMPQPRVTVNIPEPEIIVTWPDSTLNLAELEPHIEVRIPEPQVNVTMPEPVVELTIGGGAPGDLVELEDGRFAPEGATAEDLEPRIAVRQADAVVSRGQDAEAPEIHFNRGEPLVTYEGEEPEVSVQVVGEPEIVVTAGRRDGQPDGTLQEGAPQEMQAQPGEGEQPPAEGVDQDQQVQPAD